MSQLPPLTEAMYWAARGAMGDHHAWSDDDLDHLWEAINTALRTAGPAPTADLRAALLRIRAGIAADRCDGESEWANGVNAACKNHLEFVDAVLAAAGVLGTPETKENDRG